MNDWKNEYVKGQMPAATEQKTSSGWSRWAFCRDRVGMEVALSRQVVALTWLHCGQEPEV